MAANPLTYSELEAFERKALIRFSAWETGLIMRLDDEVLAVWRDSVANPASNKPNEPEATEIPVEDTEGLRVMFKARAAQRRLQAEAAARVKAERAAQTQAGSGMRSGVSRKPSA